MSCLLLDAQHVASGLHRRRYRCRGWPLRILPSATLERSLHASPILSEGTLFYQNTSAWRGRFRRTGVGNLFELQQERGWEDLEVPQRFYVEVGTPKADRSSVMDRLELARKKDVRGR